MSYRNQFLALHGFLGMAGLYRISIAAKKARNSGLL
jgi:hypothetical protein